MKIQISQCPSLILRGRESGLYPDMIFPPNLPLEPQLLPFLESGALGSKSRAAFSIPQPRRGEAFFHFQPYLLGSSGSELPTLCYGLEPPLQHYSSVPPYPQYVHTTPTEMQGKSFLAPGKAPGRPQKPLRRALHSSTLQFGRPRPSPTPRRQLSVLSSHCSEGTDPMIGASVRLGT